MLSEVRLRRPKPQSGARLVVWLALPALYLMTVWWAFDRAPASLLHLAQQFLWTTLVLVLGIWPGLVRGQQHAVAWLPLILAGLGGLVLYAATQQTSGAWLLLGSSYACLLAVDRRLASGRGLGLRLLLHATTIGGGALWAVTLGQLETGFADEEFFVAIQLGILLGLMILLLLAAYQLAHTLAPRSHAENLPHVGSNIPPRPPADRRHGGWIAAWMGLWGVLVPAVLLWSYADSFYPRTVAVPFPGIAADAPFLCATLSPEPAAQAGYTSEQIFADYLAQVAENPYKGPPELAMLALGTRDTEWVQAFRAELLSEAAAGLFTDPAHSVKSVQHYAAQRIYYTAVMRQEFPDLFSDQEMTTLASWFAAINRRAHTIEWVDWMYALAFWKSPEGPYENQESGAGLIAVLEWTSWADADTQAANLDYLSRNPRGWRQRFRNTDDAYVYQLEWLTNAWFQHTYQPADPAVAHANLRHAYDWLALQLMPNGAAPYYNHVARPSVAASLALGAELLDDPQLLWLAGHALTQSREENRLHYAQPGLLRPPDLSPQPPATGSCLLYGDSGLPNQQGPLAPDKIVFRDGWNPDANYLMLNLRFTGWHRYKATNAVAFVQAGEADRGPQVADAANRNPYAWLPAGRSLFRDKRVPRENLSGLLIPNSGMSALLYRFTGVGSPWAQDPPDYAQVMAFDTGSGRDYSHTRLANWRRWVHDREIHFIHAGPIVIIDQAHGPGGESATLGWQFTTEVESLTDEGNPPGVTRLRLGDQTDGVQVLLVPLEELRGTNTSSTVALLRSDAGGVEARYAAATPGQLGLATVFLADAWRDATVTYQPQNGSAVLQIVAGENQVQIPLPQPRD